MSLSRGIISAATVVLATFGAWASADDLPTPDEAKQIFFESKQISEQRIADLRLKKQESIDQLSVQETAVSERLKRCTSFECANQCKSELEALHVQKKQAEQEFNRSYSDNLQSINMVGSDLIIRTYSRLIKDYIQLASEYDFAEISEWTDCAAKVGNVKFSPSYWDEENIGIIHRNLCRQSLITFKFKDSFYKAIIVIGAAYLEVTNNMPSKVFEGVKLQEAQLVKLSAQFDLRDYKLIQEFEALNNKTFDGVVLHSPSILGYSFEYAPTAGMRSAVVERIPIN